MKVSGGRMENFRPRTLVIEVETPNDLAVLYLGLVCGVRKAAVLSGDDHETVDDGFSPIIARVADWVREERGCSNPMTLEQALEWGKHHLGCVSEMKARP